MVHKISVSETTTDKHETYTSMTSRHKTAMKHGFYLEAMLIDYAMLEDRLTAFLWSAGVMNDTDNFSFGNRRNKSQLSEIYTAYAGENKKPRLRNISGKINTILALIDFGSKPYNGDDRYLSALHKGLQEIRLDELKETLSALDDWREYRNEIIHDAMNKNIYSLYEHLEEYAESGLKYARVIDNESKKLKRRSYIRKSVKMPLKK